MMTEEQVEKAETLGKSLISNGVSRRTFLKFCSTVASAMALPPASLMCQLSVVSGYVGYGP